jgi:hypothetical protein
MSREEELLLLIRMHKFHIVPELPGEITGFKYCPLPCKSKLGMLVPAKFYDLASPELWGELGMLSVYTQLERRLVEQC